MSQQTIDHIVNPNGTIIEIHDHERGQPNGVVTLDANGKVVQTFNGYAIQLASPDGNGSLVDFVLRHI